MVRVERISKPPKEEEVVTMYDNIFVYVTEPTQEPDEECRVAARPWEFEAEEPVKFATSCPHCGQGIFFEANLINELDDNRFIACPECGGGSQPGPSIPPFSDPFRNPIRSGSLNEQDLDSELLSALSGAPDEEPLTVAEKMADREVAPRYDLGAIRDKTKSIVKEDETGCE